MGQGGQLDVEHRFVIAADLSSSQPQSCAEDGAAIVIGVGFFPLFLLLGVRAVEAAFIVLVGVLRELIPGKVVKATGIPTTLACLVFLVESSGSFHR